MQYCYEPNQLKEHLTSLETVWFNRIVLIWASWCSVLLTSAEYNAILNWINSRKLKFKNFTHGVLFFLSEYDSSSDMSCLTFKICPLHLPRFTGFGEIPLGLAKFYRVWQNSIGFGKAPPGLAKIHRVWQKSTGSGKNPPGLAKIHRGCYREQQNRGYKVF